MFQKQTCNCLYLHQKETIPIQVLWNQKKLIWTPFGNDQEWTNLMLGLQVEKNEQE